MPRLKCLFLRWCRLTTEDKYCLDEHVLNALNMKGKLLYTPLREAFVQWDVIQDTQGLCEILIIFRKDIHGVGGGKALQFLVL